MAQDPSIEAKLQQMMDELQQNNPLPVDQHRAVPEQASQKAGLKHHVLDWKNRIVLPIQILAVPWIQFIINESVFGGRWDFLVIPRDVAGIPGIFLSAFSHGSWAHLIGNTIAFAIFSWLILLKSKRDFWITFLVGWLGGGLACWLFAPHSAHGLSGVVYTLFGYLLAIGWLEKRFVPLLISVFVIVNFSYTIWGILPMDPGVAWWGHLFGLILGFLSAYGVYRKPSTRNKAISGNDP